MKTIRVDLQNLAEKVYKNRPKIPQKPEEQKTPDIEITADYKVEIKDEIKKLIEVCGVNNLTCKASKRADYWKRIKKIGKYNDYPEITFEIFNGEEREFGYGYYGAGV